MGVVKGQKEFEKWESGKELTRKDAILAQCYDCNGREQSREDCLGRKTCPLYEHSPYRGI